MMRLVITEVRIGKDQATVQADGYSHLEFDDRHNYSFVSFKVPVKAAMDYPVGQELEVSFELG